MMDGAKFKWCADCPWIDVGTPDAGQAAPPSPPTITTMIASAAHAAVTFVASGGATVSDEVLAARLATCSTCSHYDGNRCDLCGCYTAIKLRLPGEACPVGKWAVDV